jgi:dipeptidyl aminopeptidase/acylaminoacyl peptidase
MKFWGLVLLILAAIAVAAYGLHRSAERDMLTLTTTPAASATPAATPGPSPTPDPYASLTIDSLTARSYGAGEVAIQQEMETTADFTRYLISYPSDDLTIYGFMDVPLGDGPFPVIIAVHGYVDPAVYGTLDYTTRYADRLAQAGYLVLHPNLREYWPSDSGPNLFRVGAAVDVLNLIGLARQWAGQPGPLEKAQPGAIGLWGHSMGGGITLRAITVNPDVKAAVLYGSMSGDERANYEQIQLWAGGTSGQEELSAPDDVIQRISPINYLDRIQAAVSIHHGANDDMVTLQWSVDLCSRLQTMAKAVECFTYEGQPHIFSGEGDQLFITRTIAFFDAHLKSATSGSPAR